LKRFLGWEPKTFYGYDDEGRMVASKQEPEWDEVEQNYMLALAEYRASKCPVCGGPIDECTDPANEGKFRTELPTRCHRQTSLLAAQEGLDGAKYAGALMLTTRLT